MYKEDNKEMDKNMQIFYQNLFQRYKNIKNPFRYSIKLQPYGDNICKKITLLKKHKTRGERWLFLIHKG